MPRRRRRACRTHAADAALDARHAAAARRWRAFRREVIRYRHVDADAATRACAQDKARYDAAADGVPCSPTLAHAMPSPRLMPMRIRQRQQPIVCSLEPFFADFRCFRLPLRELSDHFAWGWRIPPPA